MKTKKLIITLLLFTIVAVTLLFSNRSVNEPTLHFNNIVFDENGCGDITRSDFESQLNDQNIEIIDFTYEVDEDICKFYSFQTNNNLRFSISDAGIYNYTKVE